MFKIFNTQKAILDLFGEKYEVELQCNPSMSLNTISDELAIKLDLPTILPRLILRDEDLIPVSNVEVTLEITSIEGETKRITIIADIKEQLRKSRNAVILGSNSLKELEACILMQ